MEQAKPRATHEIMNTIAPIISLSQTLSAYPDNSEKTLRGLHIIQAQSERLLEFTESFRRLSYLPQPERKRFSLTALLQNLQELLSTDFQENQIHFTLTCQPEFIDMDGDENQLSQVLLNLLRNSIQALDERTDGAIEIYAYRTSIYLSTSQTMVPVSPMNCRKKYSFRSSPPNPKEPVSD